MSRPIVIGAGINGLVAAADLAIRGKSPLVLERLDRPGGAVRTEELTLPGFRHDVAAMNLSLFAGSAFMAAHGEKLARHGFELVPISTPFAQVTTPGTALEVSTDPAALMAQLSPADRAAWQALALGFGTRAELLGGLLSGPMSLPALTRWLWRAWRKLGTEGLLELIQLLLSTPRSFLDATFEDPTLKTALASWGMHLDFSPDAAGGAIFPYLEGMAGSTMGMVIGKGGAGRLTDALVALIQEHGGTVLCGQEVTAITHSAGRVTGVVAGETHKADHVLATLAPRHLARLLGKTDDARFDVGLQTFTHAPGTMMIHLALSTPIPWAEQTLGDFAYVHIGRSMDDMALVHAQARAGLLPERPVLVIGQPSLFDTGRAPEGQHIAWIQVRMVPGMISGDAAGQINATDWADAAEPYADRALAMIADHAPGLQDCILARHVVSPLELEAENPNLVGGDQICGSHALTQNFLFRPVRGYPDGRTPVRGLRLIGAATWPGAGTGAASGWRAAREI
ncbi:NAD(P)/FAD-dependent oxidoreductase [Phaeobacter sp. HF9A]|uniref:phytoene desaturase family protein n=1 Tax=Phaeobacter sp. HF9A TaxID=2721561 RepID=UPI001432259C|nr:NAD(P)/FAD-dependent oxidoreductase [Phaeobacter sp. HF9A]NIZ11979.1 NAD(P)/FAD-dependent oxidoreductase [Phaeobacter sp. HF9A]